MQRTVRSRLDGYRLGAPEASQSMLSLSIFSVIQEPSVTGWGASDDDIGVIPFWVDQKVSDWKEIHSHSGRARKGGLCAL